MAKKEEFTFEAAKKRLEQIIAQLDAGKISIDDLDAALAEAKMLIQKSLEKLENAEKIIVKWEE